MKFAIITALMATMAPSSAFIFGNQVKWIQAPSLFQDTAAQTGTLLNIHLDVGKEGESRLPIKGLQIELGTDDTTYDHPKLPGHNGPHPQLSSGPRSLELHQAGTFINMAGKQEIDLKNGAWELIWRDGAPAGSLICGFDNQKDAERNDATLPKGKVYISFPVWTKDGLAEAQIEKFRVEGLAKQYSDDRQKEIDMMGETTNFFKKALHFRNAAEAMEKHSLLSLNRAKMIPLDNEVVPMKNGLLLTSKGLVWSKEGGFRMGEHTLLGTALVETEDMLKP